MVMGLIAVILTISPFIGFILSLMFFRQKSVLPIFILFSFYFGWYYEPQLDLLTHYEHFKQITGKSLIEQWTDATTLKLGKEAYPVLFKYFIGFITDSPNFFSASACAVYTSLFVFGVILPLRPLYIQKMSFPAWLLFLAVIFTVEFYWFLGFRFWSGVFVFMGFYLRYINSGNIKYLLLSSLCICFHYSLLTLFLAALLNQLLQGKPKFYYIILIISFIIRYAKIGLIWIISQFSIFDNFIKDTNRDQRIIESVSVLTEQIREQGNQFYLWRETICIIGALAAIYILYKKTGTGFLHRNIKLWGLFILLLSLANFGFTSLTFYDRFFKIAVLILYVFAYMWIMDVQHQLSPSSQRLIVIVSILPVLYSIATPIVEARNTLFQLQLWFSNLFF